MNVRYSGYIDLSKFELSMFTVSVTEKQKKQQINILKINHLENKIIKSFALGLLDLVKLKKNRYATTFFTLQHPFNHRHFHNEYTC